MQSEAHTENFYLRQILVGGVFKALCQSCRKGKAAPVREFDAHAPRFGIIARSSSAWFKAHRLATAALRVRDHGIEIIAHESYRTGMTLTDTSSFCPPAAKMTPSIGATSA